MQPTVVALSADIILGFLVMAPRAAPGAATPAPLVLEAKISLGNIQGRIDHLAIDTARQRLYVSELGNNSIGVVDLSTNQLIQTIEGFSEPQGIDYESSTDTVYVANGGDGSVRLLRGADLQPVGSIRLGNDADNVRINSVDHRVVVGYGDGALALIDSQTRKVVADIPLKGHPESFRFDGEGHRAYVNVPDAHEIAVVDLLAQKQSASWQTDEFRSNYPMNLDNTRQILWVVFRVPPKLVAFNSKTGMRIAQLDSCADSDDLFVDTQRDRLYVSCGAGVIDVWGKHGASYGKEASITTVAGARTSVFVPELDRLYLAVRATQSEPAALWVFRAPPRN